MPVWTEEDGKLVARALGIVRDSMRGVKVTGADIVFDTIKLINEIERRMTVRGYRSSSNRSCWVQYTQADLTENDRADIFKQRMIEVQAGDPIDVVFGFHLDATPEEQNIMDAVRRVFRMFLIGRNEEKRIRDWKILHALARGKTLRDVAKRFGVNKTRIADIKVMQCGAIWKQIAELLPAHAARTEPKVIHYIDRSA